MPSEARIAPVGLPRDQGNALPRQAPCVSPAAPWPEIWTSLGLALFDALALAAGGALAATGTLPPWSALAFFLALFTAAGLARGVWRPGVIANGSWALAPLAAALAAAAAATLLAAVLLGVPPAPAGLARILLAASLALLLARATAALSVGPALAARIAPRAVLCADPASLARHLPALAAPGAGLRLLGAVAPEAAGRLARAGEIDLILLAGADPDRLAARARALAPLPVDLALAQADPATPGAALRLTPLLARRLTGWAGLAKRAQDLVLGLLLLVAFAPAMALVALAIRLDSPGPALFRQRRVGLNGAAFEMLKFRTMRHDPAPRAAGLITQASRDDPRLTRLGGFLRRTSLDELPQLFNVLRGEMSLVGPRPHAPGTAAAGLPFEVAVPDYAGRHRVRPGITGLAQVRGLRGETRTVADIAARVAADYEYIARGSPGLDLAILARTALSVLSMRNAH
jgi:lipopolysaccharide/colanic/teichoic acid biosynthesis glycosyltransferase